MKDKADQQTILYVKIFILIVVVAALISIVYKIVTLIQNSSFREGNFNTLILGKNVWITHYDPVKNRTLTIEINGARGKLLGKSTVNQMATTGVFIDAAIDMGPNGEYRGPSDIFIRPSYKYKNINDFDIAKMIFYSKVVPKDRQLTRRISSSKAPLLGTGDSVLKSFGDEKILDGQESIEVINATNLNGFGTSVGNAIKSIGFNVVKIDSDDSKKSAVYSNNSGSFSVLRIARALDIPVKTLPQEAISDIRIVVGKDLLKSNP